MERLVELFESTLKQDGNEDGAQSFAHFESLLETQKEIDMAASFIMLACALEQKVHLQHLAIAAYKRVLLLLEEKLCREKQRSVVIRTRWEKCVVFQQMGKLIVKTDAKRAEQILIELLDQIPEEETPTGGRLFSDEFLFSYTRNEFLGQVHKILTKVYLDLGDQSKMKMHYQLSINLLTEGGTKLANTNVVPDNVRQQILEEKQKSQTSIKWNDMDGMKVVPITSYSWDSSNNNGTCAVYIKMPEDITSSDQMKCTFLDSTSVFLRARASVEASITEYRLVLSPLRHEIAVDDSVCKLNQNKGKYSILMWIKDRSQKRWGADLLSSGINRHAPLLRMVKSQTTQPLPDLFNYDQRAKEQKLPTPQEYNTMHHDLIREKTSATSTSCTSFVTPKELNTTSVANQCNRLEGERNLSDSKNVIEGSSPQRKTHDSMETVSTDPGSSSPKNSPESTSDDSCIDSEASAFKEQLDYDGNVSSIKKPAVLSADGQRIVCSLKHSLILPPPWANEMDVDLTSRHGRITIRGISGLGADSEKSVDIQISERVIRLTNECELDLKTQGPRTFELIDFPRALNPEKALGKLKRKKKSVDIKFDESN